MNTKMSSSVLKRARTAEVGADANLVFLRNDFDLRTRPKKSQLAFVIVSHDVVDRGSCSSVVIEDTMNIEEPKL